MREVNDAFHIGMGRFHPPLGYWNGHFHHGILMQDTVTRPFFLAFESGGGRNAILPMHLIGVLAEGEISRGLRYEAAVANSNVIDTSTASGLEVPNRADLGRAKTLVGRLYYDDYQHPFKPGITLMSNHVRDSSDGSLAQCTPLDTLASACQPGYAR